METAEIIKALGRPIDLACDLLQSLLGKPFNVAGEIATDQLQAWQWQNRIAIAERADAVLRERRIARRIIPPDYLLPMVRAWGDVADETLQDAWARLLVAAVESDEAQHIAFVRVLEQLSGNDVKVLDAMVRAGAISDQEGRETMLVTATGLPLATVRLSFANFEHLGFFTPTRRRMRAFAITFLKCCVAEPEIVSAYSASQRDLPRLPLMD